MSKARSAVVWPAAALGLVLLMNLIFNPSSFHVRLADGRLSGSLIDIVDRAVPVMLVAIGMTPVIATRGVDLSVGSIMAISGAVAGLVLTRSGLGTAPAILLALGAGVIAGAWNGLLVAICRVQPIVSTLVLMVAGRGVAQLMTDGQIIALQPYESFAYLGGGYLLGLPVSVFILMGIFVLVAAFLRLTALGLFVEAVGANPSAGRFWGVNDRLIHFLPYVLSGLCAAIAGMIYASDITAADANNAGLYIELDAILAVVIGGTALTGGRMNLVGSVLGALVIQTLTTTLLTTRVCRV